LHRNTYTLISSRTVRHFSPMLTKNWYVSTNFGRITQYQMEWMNEWMNECIGWTLPALALRPSMIYFFCLTLYQSYIWNENLKSPIFDSNRSQDVNSSPPSAQIKVDRVLQRWTIQLQRESLHVHKNKHKAPKLYIYIKTNFLGLTLR
jgi:hypothetical protein